MVNVHLNIITATKNRLTLLLKNSKKDFFSYYLNKKKSNSTAVWSLINNYVNKTKSVKDCRPMINAEEMNNYFASEGPNSVKQMKTPA